MEHALFNGNPVLPRIHRSLTLFDVTRSAKSSGLKILPISHYGSRFWEEIVAKPMILIDRGREGGYPNPSVGFAFQDPTLRT